MLTSDCTVHTYIICCINLRKAEYFNFLIFSKTEMTLLFSQALFLLLLKGFLICIPPVTFPFPWALYRMPEPFSFKWSGLCFKHMTLLHKYYAPTASATSIKNLLTKPIHVEFLYWIWWLICLSPWTPFVASSYPLELCQRNVTFGTNFMIESVRSQQTSHVQINLFHFK